MKNVNYLNPTYPLYEVNTKVFHDGHGTGEVIELNDNIKHRSLLPYRVKFDSGYVGQYCENDLIFNNN